MKADNIKPGGRSADDYQGIISRRLKTPESNLFGHPDLLEGVAGLYNMSTLHGKELAAVHPAFDLEDAVQDARLDEVWQHLMAHYFEAMSPWLKELYQDLNEADRQLIDKEIGDAGIPLERMDDSALNCLRTSFFLMKSDALERCGADNACIVFEALKSVEITGKKMLEKPFSERKEELGDKAREIYNGNGRSTLYSHLRSLRPLDCRHISFEQVIRTVDGISTYCDCSKVINGTRHIGIILIVFGRDYYLKWADEGTPKIIYVKNPLNVTYDDKATFIELCNSMCVAQDARNRYVHDSLGLSSNPANKGVRQADISEITNLAVVILRGLHELAF